MFGEKFQGVIIKIINKMTQRGNNLTDRFTPAYTDSFGFLRTALSGTTNK